MIDGSDDDSDSSIINGDEDEDLSDSEDQRTESDMENSRRDPVIDEIEELAM